MGKTGKSRFCWLCTGLALVGTGCQKNDVEKLAKVGSTVVHKANNLTAGSNSRLTKSCQGIRLHWGQLAVDARVAARLSWDKAFDDIPIQVEADGTTVKLTGKVPDAARRRRAVELASTTTGVENVTDELEGP